MMSRSMATAADLQSQPKRIGSRSEVYRGIAFKTKGGLKQADIIKSPRSGHLRSRRRSELVRAQNTTYEEFTGFIIQAAVSK